MCAPCADISKMAGVAGDSFNCFAAFHLTDVANGIDTIIDIAGAYCFGIQSVHSIAIAAHHLANGFAIFEFQQTLFNCF